MPAKRNPLRARRLRFPVTADMIERAIPADSSHCMIADALKAAVPDARAVSVDLATVRYTDKTTGYRYVHLTPRSAQAALLQFDDGIKPEPFEFEQAPIAQIVPPRKRPAKAGTGTRKRRRATAVKNTDGGSNVPIKVGGQAPPRGPSFRGRGANQIAVGSRREFGLRAMGRAPRTS